ncbi:MAG: hypothetical protein KDJ87_04855 [Rhizobiaceae bacterium]|nr:hypothetical protein [Rhizobiaceae bacterium]
MLTDADLKAVRDAGLIDDAKLAEIDTFLRARQGPGATAPRFDLTHVLWYAGALIVMGAMGLFTNEAFNRMGGWALAACGVAYAIVFLAAGHMLWRNRSLRIPAGLLIAVAVAMTPLVVYGVQDGLDLWKYALGDPGQYKNFFPYVNGSWIYMEIGTVIAAAIAVWRYPFPFILMLAAVALWFLSMDLALWFTRDPGNYYDFPIRRLVSLYFGLGMIAIAWSVDILRRRGPDFAFWLHIFGVMAFWGGMTFADSSTELMKFVYCLINIGMIGLSLFLNRRIYAVFGAIGVATYLGYLASEVFKEVIMFSFALSAIGLAVIGLGLLINRNRARIMAATDALVPQSLAWLRPEHARAIR